MAKKIETDLARQNIAAKMHADLARSGIPIKLIKQLNFRPLLPEETSIFMKDDFEVPTYEIPYYDAHGRLINYSRLKNLEEGTSFGKAKKKQRFKYLQKPNTAPHLYIPQCVKWPRGQDKRIKVPRLVVTEGEKKAIKACLDGIFCVALGGVDSFKSSKRGILLLDEFKDFDFEDCDVEICFDSDYNMNENVRRAMNQFAAAITPYSPKSISFVMIDAESTDDGKLGLDDFLVKFEKPGESLEAFDELPRNADARQDVMAKFNAELCFVMNVGKLYNIVHDRYIDSRAAAIMEYGPLQKVPHPDDPRRMIPAIEFWMDVRTPETNVEKTVYMPGEPRRFRPTGAKLDVVNLWRPSKVKPVSGNPSLWLELTRYVMRTPENFDWFLKWLAYPLQHPGTKLLQAVFVWSRMHGVGKNFVIEPFIKNIYGDNYATINAIDLESGFNAWARCKQFIFGEEVYVSDKRERENTMGRIKQFITSPDVVINAKYRPVETLTNYAQMYMTANQPNALSLDRGDRRFMVVHAPEKKLADSFYTELDKVGKADDGPSIVYHYLLNKVDVRSFNPRMAAPASEDKDEVVEMGMDVGQHCIEVLRDQPAEIFSINGERNDLELYTSAELHTACAAYLKHRGLGVSFSPVSLGRYLAGSGVPKRKLNIHGARTALYAVFNRDRWKSLGDRHWIEHYENENKLFQRMRQREAVEGSDKKVVPIRREKKS